MEALHVMKEEGDRQHADELVKNAEWKASFLDVKVKKSIEIGDPVEKIMEHTRYNDILIMGVGRKVLLWHYVGHVTQTIVTHSSVPVILVPCIKKRWKKRMAHR
jgi:nucleotide-binding universal stress UspA family protein